MLPVLSDRLRTVLNGFITHGKLFVCSTKYSRSLSAVCLFVSIWHSSQVYGRTANKPWLAATWRTRSTILRGRARIESIGTIPPSWCGMLLNDVAGQRREPAQHALHSSDGSPPEKLFSTTIIRGRGSIAATIVFSWDAGCPESRFLLDPLCGKPGFHYSISGRAKSGLWLARTRSMNSNLYQTRWPLPCQRSKDASSPRRRG